MLFERNFYEMVIRVRRITGPWRSAALGVFENILGQNPIQHILLHALEIALAWFNGKSV
jgi:hypothetical protein